MGVIRLKPADFWEMSYLEWQCCTEGYIENFEAQSGFIPPLTRAELLEMEANYYGDDGDSD